ncbi:MAG TPA: PH domain-containing protein [Candidatus Binatia bacterium]|nr:PH domain-containing protein [Candidatus Binatia bacterium]
MEPAYSRPSPRFWLARQMVIGLTGTGLAVVLAGAGALTGRAIAEVAASGAVGGGAAAGAGAGALVALLLTATGWAIERGRYRAWGYLERDDDLMVRRGLLFRRLTVVPFGRMQFVDVSAGPVDRLFDLATVQLHTAAAATDARIPGLRTADATRLRDRLAALGEARASGI